MDTTTTFFQTYSLWSFSMRRIRFSYRKRIKWITFMSFACSNTCSWDFLSEPKLSPWGIPYPTSGVARNSTGVQKKLQEPLTLWIFWRAKTRKNPKGVSWDFFQPILGVTCPLCYPLATLLQRSLPKNFHDFLMQKSDPLDRKTPQRSDFGTNFECVSDTKLVSNFQNMYFLIV